MKSKKLKRFARSIFILLVIVLGIIGLRYIGLRLNERSLIKKGSESIVQKNKTSEKILTQGIEVNNFKANPVKIISGEEYVISTNSKFTISYFPINDGFLIILLDKDFIATRSEAENTLLTILGIEREAACRLKVNTTTPKAVNPSMSGRIFTLSWCEG